MGVLTIILGLLALYDQTTGNRLQPQAAASNQEPHPYEIPYKLVRPAVYIPPNQDYSASTYQADAPFKAQKSISGYQGQIPHYLKAQSYNVKEDNDFEQILGNNDQDDFKYGGDFEDDSSFIGNTDGYEHYKSGSTSHFEGPGQIETISTDSYHKEVGAFDTSSFKTHHDESENHGEVHYHEHKHIHKHDHKQKHMHKHKQEHKHHHGHKHEAHHKHEHGHKHDNHHKHDHQHGHKHEHHAQHKHQHQHGHKHGHHASHKHHHDQHHKHEHGHHHAHGHKHHGEHKHEHQHGHKHQHHGEHKHHHGHKHQHGHKHGHKHSHGHESHGKHH